MSSSHPPPLDVGDLDAEVSFDPCPCGQPPAHCYCWIPPTDPAPAPVDEHCDHCGGSGEVPLYSRTGSHPCPRCCPSASLFDAVREVAIGEGEAILVGPEGSRVIPDPEAVRVAGVRVTWERVDAFRYLLDMIEDCSCTPREWLRRAYAALGERGRR